MANNNGLLIRLDLRSTTIDLCDPNGNPVEITERLVAGLTEYLQSDAGKTALATGIYHARGACSAFESGQEQTLQLEIDLDLKR
jgi:hypothetical protein